MNGGIDRTTAGACLALAVGLWLLLPCGRARGKALGVLLITAALGLSAAQLHPLGDSVSDAVFYVIAAVTLVSAVGAVTMRSPVYCAIWFALTLLGTAGLFFFQGAQFLGTATIVVYAGAILVTFLFVLMLCNPEGRASSDRLSWEAGVSAATGALLVFLLSWTTASTEFGTAPVAQSGPAAAAPIVVRATTVARERNILTPRHVERLGAELFGRHLIAVETAGTLLLAALVGAVAIVAHGRQTTSAADADDRSEEARHG